MSNALPFATSASHTLTASRQGIHTSNPKSPVYPVREMSTGTPAIFPCVTRKYFRFVMSASAASCSTFPDIGPCSASAAVCSEISSIVTFSASAFCQNHRRLGSAAVQRYSFSPTLVLVMHLVDVDGVIARPFAVVQAFAQRQRSFMKRGSDRQESS